MPDSPLTGSEGALRIGIRSNGQPIADDIAVVSVHLRAAVGHAASARLVIVDGDMVESRWPVADGATFQPGAVIRIAAGYGDAGEQTLFEGTVARLGMQIRGDNTSRLVVDCRRAAADEVASPRAEAGAVLKLT